MNDPREVLRAKRDGGTLDPADIDAFLRGAADGSIPDFQVTALLMAVFQHGLDPDELRAWTGSMLDSGARLDLAGVEGPFVDKHSTGGVGDKASLPLAPALAACGVRVPMISGRGLGHTGGTLDKLEAIEGFRTGLALDELREVLRDSGWLIAAQTAELVPADRRLYALRDATATVESIPLIASSILSKKLAEGLDALVLDVKAGSGAFLPEPERGRELARTLLSLAHAFGLPCVALLTAMDRPLGVAVGHALELRETLACLRGGGPPALRELVLDLGAPLLARTGAAADEAAARARLAASLDDGAALATFEQGVRAQGGDPASIERVDPGVTVEDWGAPGSGVLDLVDCRAVGLACADLGGGRRLPDDAIDFGVGIEWLGEVGAEVRAGEPVARLHHRDGRGLERARARLAAAVALDTGRAPLPRVVERLESEV